MMVIIAKQQQPSS